ncbi:MAG TPA: isoprenylcysteine carboxylmethyltransferase family protein [Gemmatimonadaceae bacterium]|nr:isoprenylcysteine carboxylmethyltransferase family protein [Gemmatimonadaceae bacterium]
MTIHAAIILGLWLTLMVVWVASAPHAKPTIGGGRVWRRAVGARLMVAVLIIIAIRASRRTHVSPDLGLRTGRPGAVAALIGTMCCVVGVAIAIWARVTLGRNWGMPMSRKENPELVTTGPYAYIRHPIYSGFLFAMLGSTIALSIVWVIPLIVSGLYFTYSARREERIMIAQFPEAYAAYRRRTKMLIPFVL